MVSDSLNKTVSDTRIEWVDIAKGFGMIFVILLHTGASKYLHIIFGSFHMPLFFMIAGFFLFAKEYKFKKFAFSKVRTLIIPYLLFGVILASYSTVLDIVKGSDNIPGLRYIGLLTNMRRPPFHGSLWFLLSLFTVEILIFFVHKKFKSNLSRLIVCMSAFLIGGGILTWYGKGLPLCLDLTLICIIFCQIGYFVYPYIHKLNSVLWISLFSIAFFISAILNYHISGDSVDLFSCRIGNPILFFIAAVTGSILTLILALRIGRNKWLSYIGKNSLLYYCLQFIFLLIVGRTITYIAQFIPFSDHFAPFVKTAIIITILVPIINYINNNHRWMLGRFKS